ncbi:GNAT family N-acetyltransferase [Microbacterium xylanilyticum]
MSGILHQTSGGLSVRLLGEDTWNAFAALVEAKGGVWGGCWCMGFHVNVNDPSRSAERNRAEKQERVAAGTTHAALVFEHDACVGWCQCGSPAEVPRIKSSRAYEKGLTALPDWRVTCFFTGKGHRKRGVASAALAGALTAIANLGGGTVEGYPEETDDRRVSGSFLHTGTMPTFERWGFQRIRPISPHRWVVARMVQPATR